MYKTGSRRVFKVYGVVERGGMYMLERSNRAHRAKVWYESIELARKAAQELAKMTLAQKIDIVVTAEKSGGAVQVMEEIELPPLAERVRMIHLQCLKARHPERFKLESSGLYWSAPSFAKPALGRRT